MPLDHFVSEAKKNTPVLKTIVSEEAEAAIIDARATPGQEIRKKMAEISKAEQVVAKQERVVPGWKTCKYLKTLGDKEMCKQYMVLCAKEKCQRKFMEADFFDFKKHLKSGKPIK